MGEHCPPTVNRGSRGRDKSTKAGPARYGTSIASRTPVRYLGAFSVFLSVFLLLGERSIPTAHALSCAEPRPVCEAVGRSEVVFLGQALGDTDSKGKTRFQVRKTFVGSLPAEVTVSTSTAWGPRFRKGTRYLIYGGQRDGQISTGSCSRTRPESEAQEDLEYLRENKKRRLAEVGGKVYFDRDRKPAENVVMRVVGTRRTTRVDASGNYRFSLPPGEYEIGPSGVGLSVKRKPTITVKVRSGFACHRGIDFKVVWNGKVEGRITDPGGRPLAGVKVAATATSNPARYAARPATTDNNGRYSISGLGTGDYHIVVSPPQLGGVSAESPHPTTYYPGTSAANRARAVAMRKAGGVVTGIDFAVPLPQPVYTVKGIALGADNKPLDNAMVEVHDGQGEQVHWELSEADGSFEFSVLGGTHVTIAACPQGRDRQKCARNELTVNRSMKLTIRPYTPRPATGASARSTCYLVGASFASVRQVDRDQTIRSGGDVIRAGKGDTVISGPGTIEVLEVDPATGKTVQKGQFSPPRNSIPMLGGAAIRDHQLDFYIMGDNGQLTGSIDMRTGRAGRLEEVDEYFHGKTSALSSDGVVLYKPCSSDDGMCRATTIHGSGERLDLQTREEFDATAAMGTRLYGIRDGKHQVHVFDVETGSEIESIVLTGVPGRIRGLGVQGEELVVASEHRRALVLSRFDLETGRKKGRDIAPRMARPLHEVRMTCTPGK